MKIRLNKVIDPAMQTICVLLLSMTLAGCASLISTYDHRAYEQAIDVKVESLFLMEMASESFSDHEADVMALRKLVAKASEYEKGRAKNEITVQMWEKFSSPDHNLLGGFLARWEAQGTLKPMFITESKKIMSSAIDQIIGLESGKIKKK